MITTIIDYIKQQLKDINFTDTEITAFLTLIYNQLQYNNELESQISYTVNLKYIDAFVLLNDEIYSVSTEEWKQWKLTQ